MTFSIVSVAQMRGLEAAAFGAGITEAELQQHAGAVVAEEVHRRLEPGERVVVLVGHGNNGRDGGVAAEWLAQHGVAVEMILAPRHAIMSDELARLRDLGVSTVPAEDAGDVQRALDGADVAIDALAGIGTHGALREPLATLARQLNQTTDTFVVALDVPSGVDADSGEAPGETVRADLTVTLGAIKQGLLRFPSAERVGQLVTREIGIPAGAELGLPCRVLDVAGMAPPRPMDAHKYRFGRVLVLAGSDHFLGAPVLSSGGALRVGAGLVTVGSTASVRLTVAAHLPEATFTTRDVNLDVGAAASYLNTHDAVVIGPGLGRGPAQTAFVRAVLEQRTQGKLVIDADALVALAEIPEWWTLLGPNAVLTPHSGELERLVGSKPGYEPPWVCAGRLAQQWQCVLIAKGPFTSVAAPSGEVNVWPRANSALATGGTGDVLAGMCGGLIAQGCAVFDAARLAVGAHALAAERVIHRRRWRTLLASDLLQEIPAVLAELSTQPR
jgi:NAD(P)H-hydrate epimerase